MRVFPFLILIIVVQCSTVSKFERFEKKLDTVIQEKTKSLNALKAKENRTVEENRRIEFYESELSSLDSLKSEFSGMKEAYTDLEKSYSDLRWRYYKTVVFSWLGRIGWIFVGLIVLVFYCAKYYFQIHG